jgi:hypothetical protein
MNPVGCATNQPTSSTGRNTMEMLNLGKWNNQTIESVRHVLNKANMPCVGFSLVFLEPLAEGHSNFRFKTMLAFDPNNPVP